MRCICRGVGIVGAIVIVGGNALAQNASEPRAIAAPTLHLTLAPSDSQERPRAVTLSDGYYKRLKFHRIGSYVMLPLFAAEYYLGDQLIKKEDPASWVKGTHSAVAGGIGVVFGVNTVTGVWNLVESRKVSDGKARRFLHAALLLASDAGFLYTASLAGKAEEGNRDASSDHRNAALMSIGASTVGTVMMWLWK